MNGSAHSSGFLRELVWQDLLLVLAVLVVSRLVVLLVRWTIRRAAELTPPPLRLKILRWPPKMRLAIEIATAAIILPILAEPTFQNTVALIATVGLALAFAFKDYGSCLIAGLVTILEGTYQPGDWIEADGTYGEVKSIGTRAVHIVTADDTEVIVPHSKLWSVSVFNASSGNRSLFCATNYDLHPDHDGAEVTRRLMGVARSSQYVKPKTAVVLVASEKPWGTHYKVKVYVTDSREQFRAITDLTIRGKATLRELGVQFAQAAYAETG